MVVRGVLLDIDGVLHVGGTPVEGAAETVSQLKEEGIPFRCISNTTRSCRATIAARLRAMGIRVPEEHIFTPARAASRLLEDAGSSHCLMLVAEDVMADLPGGLESGEEEADAVVIGDAGDAFSYASLNRAFRMILGGAEMIALEKDRYWMAADGLSLSAGPFVAGLEYATGRIATLVGKPSPHFFSTVLADMCLAPDEVLMVGDDLSTDIRGAQEAGMRAALVRTGKYRAGYKDPAITPDFTIDSVADLFSILCHGQ